jgi:hypothetical protein
VLKIGLNWQKLTDFKTFSGYFHVLQVIEHTADSFRTNSVKKMRLFKKVGQGCRARLPGKAAGQGCRARLPGKAAGQGCRARLYAILTGKLISRTVNLASS